MSLGNEDVEVDADVAPPSMRRHSSRTLWSAAHPETRDPLPIRFRRPRLFRRFRWRRGRRVDEAAGGGGAAEQRVFLSAPAENAHHAKNLFITSKYTALTFLPKNLWEQARRVANTYFIIITVLTLIPIGISPIPAYITVVPLVLILGIVAVKEGYEDLMRHRSDARVNNAPVLRLDESGSSHTVPSREVRVGDIIAVSRDEVCAADIVVLATDHQAGGPVCWVDTANLDGETRLKVRRALPLRRFLNLPDDDTQATPQQLAGLEAVLTSDAPNPYLEVFSGRLDAAAPPDTTATAAAAAEEEEAAEDGGVDDAAAVQIIRENLILRGAVLRNTRRVWGVVVGAGPTTKLRMNQQLPVFKFSRLERQMNTSLGVVFALQTLLCIAFASALLSTQDIFRDGFGWGFPDVGQAAATRDWVYAWMTWFILLSFMIPMSLYVILEMGKLVGGLYIHWDAHMYSRDGLQRPAKPNTTSLVDELGMIEYILSDKTGTLTDNEMLLTHCGTRHALYALRDGGHLEVESLGTDGGNSGKAHTQRPASAASSGSGSSTGLSAGSPANGGSSSGGSAALARDAALRELLLIMAVCNELEVEPEDGGAFEYSGESPDEVALADAAASLGAALTQRAPTHARVLAPGGANESELEVLAVLPFTSARKRMAVAVRARGAQTVRLFYKGADSVMFDLLRESSAADARATVSALETQVDALSRKGLRTLVMASATLETRGADWTRFARAYEDAQLQLRGRDEALGAAFEPLEALLGPVGCTGVEDKLSDGVQDALQSLVAAGVQVAVLTGDKTETAISICYSCGLFVPHTRVVPVTDPDPDAMRAAFRSAIGDAGSDAGVAPVRKLPRRRSSLLGGRRPSGDLESAGAVPVDPHDALVLSGECLRLCLEDAALTELLVAAMMRCYTTVCTRMTPKQKAAVTKLVRRRFNKVTLAIGDGANDVSMLREAEVGVGVYGKEGSQAVNAADFALHRFADLKRLIFVHGATCRMRIVSAARASLYANIALSFPQAFYGFMSAYSGTNIEVANVLTVVNLAVTSPFLLCLAMLDRELLPEELAANPRLFDARQFMFTLRQFGGEVLLALWHAAVALAAGFAFGTVWRADGVVGGRPVQMTALTLTIVGGTLVALALRFRCVTWIHVGGALLSVLVLVAAALLVPMVWQPSLTDNGYILAYVDAAPSFWLVLALGIFTSALPDWTLKAAQSLYNPSPMQRFREQQRARGGSI